MFGELAALARLRALGDLDFQLLGLREVPRGHSEAGRRNLLDLVVRRNAVAGMQVPIGVLAALAAIASRTQLVHRQCECANRLG